MSEQTLWTPSGYERPQSRTASRGGAAGDALASAITFFKEAINAAPFQVTHVLTDRWRRLADMRTPRHGLGGVGYGSRVFAISGSSSTTIICSGP